MNDAIRDREIFPFKSAITLKACCVLVKIRKFSLAELTWEAFRFLIVTQSNCGGIESPLVALELSDVNESVKDSFLFLLELSNKKNLGFIFPSFTGRAIKIR